MSNYAIKKHMNCKYGVTYYCNHTLYNECTLYLIGNYGLSVIQQRFDKVSKSSKWTSIDTNLIDNICLNTNFKEFFNKYASVQNNGIYPTVTLRQLMWGIRMKPLPKEPWETYFDRKPL